MSGVYGTFYENFLELQECFRIWTKEDMSDVRSIVAIFMPSGGSAIKRRKYTSGNTSQDIIDTDEFYVRARYFDKVGIGDYVQKPNDPFIYRLTGMIPYDKSAGYRIYTIEKVTGHTPDKNQELKVKEATFA